MTAEAATLTFDLDDVQGSDSSITQVMLDDVTGGVKMTFTVTDPVNTADIAAVYFNLGATAPATPYTITGAAGVVTGVAYDTKNVQAGNIGETFDVGVAIGNTGSGSDFFDTFMITVSPLDLDVTDFLGQTFASRGQSVGSGLTGGSGSSKMFGTAPSAVPLPAAGFLLLGGLGVVAGLRRMRKPS